MSLEEYSEYLLTNLPPLLTLTQSCFTNLFMNKKNLYHLVLVPHVKVKSSKNVNLNFALHGPEEVKLLPTEC